MRNNRPYLFFLAFGMLVMAGAAIFSSQSGHTLNQLAEITGSKLNSKIKLCEKEAGEVFTRNFDLEQADKAQLPLEKSGHYVFVKDSLIFWNNAQWEIGSDLSLFKDSSGFVRLRHGFFIYCKKNLNDTTTIVIYPVKPSYELQNNYLNNDFCAWLKLPKDVELDSSTFTNTKVILQGHPVFSLKGNEPNYYDESIDAVCSLIFILGYITVLIVLLLLVKNHYKPYQVMLFVTSILLLRMSMLYFQWPGCIYRTMLYDLRLFGNAQSYINGFLGDVFLNALTLFFISVAFLFQHKNTKSGQLRVIGLTLLSLFILFSYHQFNKVIVSLVNNSTLNFDFLSIFSVKLPTFVTLAAVCVILLSIFISINQLISQLKGHGKAALIFTGLLLIICIIEHAVNDFGSIGENYWLLVAALPIYVIKMRGQNTALSLGIYVLAATLVTSSFLTFYIKKNQSLDLEVLMQKLSEREDNILENEFNGLPLKIATDENLKNLIELLPASDNEIEQKLKQKYFNGYFDRYTIGLSLFDKNCTPLLSPKMAVLLNEGFFEDQINYYSKKVTDGLYFVDKNLSNTQYIAKITIGDYTLFALLEAKHFEEVGSFPDLFLDQSLQKQDKLKAFSYSVYRNGQNTDRFGEFNYPYFFQDSSALSKTSLNYVHHYFEPEPEVKIIISQAAKTKNYFFTFNSYVLLFFSLFTYFGYVCYTVIFTTQFNNPSLTRRIQTIIILLLLLAMSAVGITSGNLVTEQFTSENQKNLEEKTSIIVSEISNQFSQEQLFDETQKELLNIRLREYSRLFSTPISLYNKKGELFTTSEPKLYNFGLASLHANPIAYRNLTANLSSAICVNEKAGSLNYLSLYTPLFNNNKSIAGFINLPYFARQSNLTNDLSQIISALINVYVILFVLSIVAGLILSGYITQPLRLIKQQLAKITLGTKNEKIIWQSNDEIGKLVTEYNQMLLKLEESANLLARSERESAWREMAKQVAHEIKNPLTPMKLNIQYLQHLMKSNPEDFKERFEKASVGIIEQIDTLASIATEFSNFAKLPGIKLEVLNLTELISSTVEVFSKHKHVSIVNQILSDQLMVKVDREQCLRVFNNLLQNAVQATEETQEAHIEINCEQKSNRLIISIKDNGCGISEELKPKIFSPNFTTKSTGSGLGLAMVKNIMEGFGGRIYFESEKNKGSVFYIEFIDSVFPD